MLEKSGLITLALMAAFLTSLASPRLFSSIETLYSYRVFQQVSSGDVPAEAVFQKAHSHLVSAIDWVDSDFYWRQLSFLKLNQFNSSIELSSDVDSDIADLYATAEIAVSLMPADPYIWHDMYMIQSLYPETLETALSALKMSIYVDRTNKNLLPSRLLFLWRNFVYWDAEMRSIFSSQLVLLWKSQPYLLIQIVKSNPGMSYFIKQALANSPDDLIAFNKLKLKYGL